MDEANSVLQEGVTMDQEQYLKETGLWPVVARGVKKLVTELTSVKTLFLAFLCVAIAKGWIGDVAGIIGGLATLGVKEIPSEVFTGLIEKVIPGGLKHG
jgi:hypothetical protein